MNEFEMPESDNWNSYDLDLQSVQRLIKVTEKSIQGLEDLRRESDSKASVLINDEYEELKLKLGRLIQIEARLMFGSEFCTRLKDSSDSSQSPSPTISRVNKSSDDSAPGSYADVSQETDRSLKSTTGHFRLFFDDSSNYINVECRHCASVLQILTPEFEKRGTSVDDIYIYNSQTRKIINWDTDSIFLDGLSIGVVSRLFHGSEKPAQLHQFEKKFFMPYGYCSMCLSYVLKGYRCKICLHTFHRKCCMRIATTEKCSGKKISSKTIFGRKKSSGSRTSIETADDICADTSFNGNYSSIKTFYKRTNSSDLISSHNSSSPIRLQGDHALQDSKLIPIRKVEPLLSIHPTPEYSKILVDKNLEARLQESNTRNSYKGGRVNRLNRFRGITRHDSRYNEWEISSSEIEIGKKIGSGSYGTVFQAKWHGYVAVKMLNVCDPTTEQLEAFRNEVLMLRKTRHINILLFMGCIYKPKLAIVTQWCDGSTLYKHIHVLETDFSMTDTFKIIFQTGCGMEYLHAKGIIHRDLKSNNIFLLENLLVKIGDFGLATVKSTMNTDSSSGQQPTGSVLWMAPEVIKIKERNPYSFYSDVYSYGIVLFEMFSCQLPYAYHDPPLSVDQIMYLVATGILKPDMYQIFDNITSNLIQLYLDCINYDANKRPLFPEILNRISDEYHRVPKIFRTTSAPDIGGQKYDELLSIYDSRSLIPSGKN